MWNIAHNMGGFLAPILAGTAAKMYGWQWGMFAPGLVGIVMGLLILLGVRDSPEAIGYPPVEAREEKKGDDGKPAAQESLVSLLVNDCLKNPYVVGLALTYFFVYVVRQGVTSWFVFYLLQVKGVADAGAASLRVSGLELGGLFGSLLAGKLSDMLINNSKGGGGNVGKRVQVNMSDLHRHCGGLKRSGHGTCGHHRLHAGHCGHAHLLIESTIEAHYSP
jgi:sugar phosphate permease